MLMGNTDSLRVELALCELIVEVAHYELVEVALHKLIGVVFHNQQKRILISCFQEIGVAFWHFFSSSRVKETFSLPQSESEL